MRLHPARTWAVQVAFSLFACGSPDTADDTHPDATTGSEAGHGQLDAGSVGGSAALGGTGGRGQGSAAGSSASSGSGGGAGSMSQAGASAGSDADAGSTSQAGAGAEAVCDPSCMNDEHCELVQVTCIRAPCPPVPMCVAPKAVSCDPAKILCKRATPQCPDGQVPSVSGSCYGACVPVETCSCGQASECPNHDSYTCHMSAGHCGPYV
jgi:hypothetical protein